MMQQIHGVCPEIVESDFKMLGSSTFDGVTLYVVEFDGEIWRWMKEANRPAILCCLHHERNTHPYVATITEELYLLLLLRWG